MGVKIILWFWWLCHYEVWLVGTRLIKKLAASVLRIEVSKVVTVVACIGIVERGLIVHEE
jgi:hypothetical protein